MAFEREGPTSLLYVSDVLIQCVGVSTMLFSFFFFTRRNLKFKACLRVTKDPMPITLWMKSGDSGMLKTLFLIGEDAGPRA